MEESKWISVKEKLPDIFEGEPHRRKLIIVTEIFGPFLGFHDGKHFRTNYANILENVTHWMPLPPPPDAQG